jgi:nucleoside-diphosphate-sugar epimerase
MNVLVTGGAGYLGSVLVPHLLAAGHRVTVIDSFMYGQASLLDCCHDPKLEIVRGDARDSRLVAEHLKGKDAVLPLACLTGAPACERDPAGATSVNLDAVRALLEARSREQRIVFPTTNSGYGVGESGLHCTEETPLRPLSLYGRLKVDAEKMLLDAPNTITLRFATVFGVSPRMRLDLLVNDFTYRAVTDRFIVLFEAHFKRNYLHVRDAARAFLHCLERFETMRGEPYNVGLDDANLSKAELCDVIRAQVPAFYWVEADVGKDPDQRNYIVSNAKIARTGYAAEVSLERGVAELIKGFQVIRRAGYSNV